MDDFQLLLHEADRGALLIALSGEVDMATAPTLRHATRTAIDSGAYTRLVFDLSQVRFIDSSGLHVLVESKRRMNEAGGDTYVVNTAPHIAKLLEVTGLTGLLNVSSDRDSALGLAAA